MPSKPLSGITGAHVAVGRPVSGTEKDEITALVSRIKRADELARQPRYTAEVGHMPSEQDIKWAEDWKLPKEVFDYFILERAA